MSAGVKKLISSVQGCRFRVEHNVVLLSKAKLAFLCNWIENPGSGHRLPGDFIWDIFTLKFPNVFAECGFAFVFLMSEVMHVLVIFLRMYHLLSQCKSLPVLCLFINKC